MIQIDDGMNTPSSYCIISYIISYQLLVLNLQQRQSILSPMNEQALTALLTSPHPLLLFLHTLTIFSPIQHHHNVYPLLRSHRPLSPLHAFRKRYSPSAWPTTCCSTSSPNAKKLSYVILSDLIPFRTLLEFQKKKKERKEKSLVRSWFYIDKSYYIMSCHVISCILSR